MVIASVVQAPTPWLNWIADVVGVQEVILPLHFIMANRVKSLPIVIFLIVCQCAWAGRQLAEAPAEQPVRLQASRNAPLVLLQWSSYNETESMILAYVWSLRGAMVQTPSALKGPYWKIVGNMLRAQIQGRQTCTWEITCDDRVLQCGFVFHGAWCSSCFTVLKSPTIFQPHPSLPPLKLNNTYKSL
jgi:hypothetical protein